MTLGQGVSVGAVWTLYETARQLGIVAALGSARQGKLALWQTIARVIDQGSRLSAVRLARQPNQYTTADQLLRDVWDGGIKSPDTIRSAVRYLRQRLSSAGMEDCHRAG